MVPLLLLLYVVESYEKSFGNAPSDEKAPSAQQKTKSPHDTQQLLIVHLEEQISKMQSEKDLHESQIEAQKGVSD